MHSLFEELLKTYEFNRLYLSPLKEQFLHICEALANSGKEDRLNMEQNLGKLNTKLEKLEERISNPDAHSRAFVTTVHTSFEHVHRTER